MLAVRIRQLTAEGLSPSKTSSLVGRYPGLSPAVDQRLFTAHFRFEVSYMDLALSPIADEYGAGLDLFNVTYSARGVADRALAQADTYKGAN